jgi:Cdc6-like AAA superfamily ATPase
VPPLSFIGSAAGPCLRTKSETAVSGKCNRKTFSAVKILPETGEVLVQKPGEDVPKVFTFDSVYDWNSEQESVFAETAFTICENVIQGYNGTIFAYGQTGTGKTFTISGIAKDPVFKGIMPRAFETIFS